MNHIRFSKTKKKSQNEILNQNESGKPQRISIKRKASRDNKQERMIPEEELRQKAHEELERPRGLLNDGLRIEKSGRQ